MVLTQLKINRLIGFNAVSCQEHHLDPKVEHVVLHSAYQIKPKLQSVLKHFYSNPTYLHAQSPSLWLLCYASPFSFVHQQSKGLSFASRKTPFKQKNWIYNKYTRNETFPQQPPLPVRGN